MNAKIALMGMATVGLLSCQSKTNVQHQPSISEEKIKHSNDSLEILKQTVPVTRSRVQRDSIVKNYRSIF